MRLWICIGMLMATTVSAYAGTNGVPEIDAFAGLAAMGVVGSSRRSSGSAAGANKRSTRRAAGAQGAMIGLISALDCSLLQL